MGNRGVSPFPIDVNADMSVSVVVHMLVDVDS
jgi:hypothetical protein